MPNTPAWPSGCKHPNSCARHGVCGYIPCEHSRRDIGKEIAYELARIELGTVADIPDNELLRRAVSNARRWHRRSAMHPRREGVMDAFSLGSTYAAQLCRRFGLDPDEIRQAA